MPERAQKNSAILAKTLICQDGATLQYGGGTQQPSGRIFNNPHRSIAETCMTFFLSLHVPWIASEQKRC